MTAIAVSNNAVALGTLRYLNVHHLQIGTDLQLLGFSGNDWYGYRTEKIAQVSQPTEEMARMAGQQLLEQIEDPKPPGPHHRFAQHLYPQKTGKGVFSCLISSPPAKF